jgi:hypothetical protein
MLPKSDELIRRLSLSPTSPDPEIKRELVHALVREGFNYQRTDYFTITATHPRYMTMMIPRGAVVALLVNEYKREHVHVLTICVNGDSREWFFYTEEDCYALKESIETFLLGEKAVSTINVDVRFVKKTT